MQAGQTLGPFRILAELGRGAMGTVFAAEDLRLQRMVALKLAHGGGGSDDGARRRLLREARAAATVAHPNIAAVYEVGEVDGAVYIAMELVGGRSLRQLLEEGPLPLATALRVGREIAAGLAHLHRAGVIHRDVKPANVLVDVDGRARLVDFGIAKLRAPVAGDGAGPTVTRDGDLVGTPSYMSPEQAEGRLIDERTDVFAFGAVLYEMVAGRRAFAGESAMQAVASVLRDQPAPLTGVPAELVRVIERCLEKSPEDRFAGFERVDDALALVRLDGPVEPSPWEAPTVPAAARPAALPTARASGSRWRWGAGAVLAAGAAALASAAVRRSVGRSRTPPRATVDARWRPQIVDLPKLYDERAEHPALSPDGHWVAYVSDRGARGEEQRIFVQPASLTVPETLPFPRTGLASAGGGTIDLRWARDGGSLLELTSQGLFRRPLDGSAAVLVRATSIAADDCGDRLVSIEPSPACRGCTHVVAVARDGSEREVMALPSGVDPAQLRCDRDGRNALAAVHVPSAARVDGYLIPLDGPPPAAPALALGDRLSGGLTLDMGGDAVFTTEGNRGRFDLLERPLTGGRTRVLATGSGRHRWPDVSADGTVLAFVDDETSSILVAQSAADRDGKPVPAAIHWDGFINLVPTRDGKELLATRVDEVVAADGSVTREYVLSAYPVPGSGLPPEERRISLGRSWVLTPAGDEVVVVRTVPGPPKSYELVVQPVAGGSARVLATLAQMPRDVRIGADLRVHYSDRIPKRGFVARSVPLAGGPVQLDQPDVALVVPLPGGRTLVVVRPAAVGDDVRVLPPGATIDSPAALRISGFAFAIDGEAVIYQPSARASLRRLGPDGHEQDLGIVPRGEEWAVSPDGATVYAAAPQGTARVQLITNLGERPRR